MSEGSALSRGDRNRNDRLARLRLLLPRENAIVGIDLANDKQAVVVADHDSRVIARRRVTCRAWELGSLLDCAELPADQANHRGGRAGPAVGRGGLMGEDRVFEASGSLNGPVDVPEPVTWGALRLSPDKDGRPRFELLLDVSRLPDEGMAAVLERVGPAVQAAVAAACGAWVDVTVSGWSYPHGDLRTVGRAQGTRPYGRSPVGG